MVTMTVRPFLDTFLMLCMTMAAARASSPAQDTNRLSYVSSNEGKIALFSKDVGGCGEALECALVQL